MGLSWLTVPKLMGSGMGDATKPPWHRVGCMDWKDPRKLPAPSHGGWPRDEKEGNLYPVSTLGDEYLIKYSETHHAMDAVGQ